MHPEVTQSKKKNWKKKRTAEAEFERTLEETGFWKVLLENTGLLKSHSPRQQALPPPPASGIFPLETATFGPPGAFGGLCPLTPNLPFKRSLLRDLVCIVGVRAGRTVTAHHGEGVGTRRPPTVCSIGLGIQCPAPMVLQLNSA